MSKLWPFGANVLFFAAAACVLPFLILYYQRLGFTGPQIGLLTGLSPLVTLASAPLWTNLADVTRRHRLVVSGILLIAAGCLIALPFLTSFWPVLAAVLALAACFIPVTSFFDSATMFTLSVGGRQELYGRVRLGGTFGYGVMGYFAGLLIQRYDIRLALWAAAALLLLTLVIAQHLRYGALKPDPAQTGSVRTLLADRRWLPFLALAFAGGLSTLVSTNYLFAYMKELNASDAAMGLAITLSTVAEVPVLFFGNRLITRFRSGPLLMAAMVITGARLLLFFFAVTPNLVLGLQLLNGLTFPLMWLAGVAYAHEHAPAGLAATAQGLFGAMVYGFGSAVGGFAGGPLFERIGGRATYIVFGLVILGIVALVALFQRVAGITPDLQ
jgi:MFS transporter, PPP family, 3-phenylpropionic acid transporter